MGIPRRVVLPETNGIIRTAVLTYVEEGRRLPDQSHAGIQVDSVPVIITTRTPLLPPTMPPPPRRQPQALESPEISSRTAHKRARVTEHGNSPKKNVRLSSCITNADVSLGRMAEPVGKLTPTTRKHNGIPADAAGLKHHTPQSSGSKASVSVDAQKDAEGALHKCQARACRLDKLDKMLESISSDSWSSTQNREELSRQLRQNPYFGAIRALMRHARLCWMLHHGVALDSIQQEEQFLGLSGNARKCCAEAFAELKQLRMVEHQTAHTLATIFNRISLDVPLCEEEVTYGIKHTRGKYDTAKQSLAGAVGSALQKKEERDSKCAFKRGHLSEDSICVLQDWLVEHFENPYPTESQKRDLVKITGVSLRQINNWMSNARFAREVDYGTISRVVYEPNWSRASSAGAHIWPKDSGQACEMVTASRDGIVISVFHNCDHHTKMQRLAQDALDEFLRLWSKVERWEGLHAQTKSRAHASTTHGCEQQRQMDEALDAICEKHLKDLNLAH